jgi:hypothetical protein
MPRILPNLLIYLIVCPGEVVDRHYQSQSPHGNAKTVLMNFFVLSIFGQFDYELETRLLVCLPGHTIRYIKRFGSVKRRLIQLILNRFILSFSS